MAAYGFRQESVWGDGFSDTSFSDLARVCDWDVVSPDEHIMFFPRLGPVAGRDLPAPVLARLRSCATALRADMVDRDGSGRVRPSRRDGAVVNWLWHRGWLEGRPLDSDGDASLGRLLVNLIEAERLGPTPPYDHAAAMRLAFCTGLNPSYVWPEAVLYPEVMLFAGWLGHLDRGRAAFVPSVLAEFLSELTASDMAHLGGYSSIWLEAALHNGALDTIRSSAKLRLDGGNPIVRLRRWRLVKPSCRGSRPVPDGTPPYRPVAFGPANTNVSASNVI